MTDTLVPFERRGRPRTKQPVNAARYQIDRVMIARRVTLKQLAELTGLSLVGLSRIKNNLSGGNNDSIARIAAALRVAPHMLYAGADIGDLAPLVTLPEQPPQPDRSAA